MNEKITPTTADNLLHGGAYAINPGQQFAFPITRDPLRPKKVAIMGTQPSSRMMAPFDDPTWTIWGSSPGNMGQLPRVDAWFEVHCNLMWAEYRSYGEPYLRWLREQRFPVVMWDHRYLPNAVIYPRREMVKRFGGFFFSSSFAWMMAYAIHVGVEEMALYGVDMSSKDEYIQQRPGGHYFIQMAKMAGINVVVPPESDLLQPPPLYGWSDASAYSRKMKSRETEIRSQLGPLEAQVNNSQQQAIYLRGALENISYMQQVWGGAADEDIESTEEATPQVASPPLQPVWQPAAWSMWPDATITSSFALPNSSASVINSPPTAPLTKSSGDNEWIIPDHL